MTEPANIVPGERCRVYYKSVDAITHRWRYARLYDDVRVLVVQNDLVGIMRADNKMLASIPKHAFRRDINTHLRVYITDPEPYYHFLKTEKPLPMSRDRVEFQLGFYDGTLETQRVSAVTRAAVEALGIDEAAVRLMFAHRTPTLIRCRPSQFARFLILRDQYGGTNDFKGLKAKLVQEEYVEKIDVSKNPNMVGSR